VVASKIRMNMVGVKITHLTFMDSIFEKIIQQKTRQIRIFIESFSNVTKETTVNNEHIKFIKI